MTRGSSGLGAELLCPRAYSCPVHTHPRCPLFQLSRPPSRRYAADPTRHVCTDPTDPGDNPIVCVLAPDFPRPVSTSTRLLTIPVVRRSQAFLSASSLESAMAARYPDQMWDSTDEDDDDNMDDLLRHRRRSMVFESTPLCTGRIRALISFSHIRSSFAFACLPLSRSLPTSAHRPRRLPPCVC